MQFSLVKVNGIVRESLKRRLYFKGKVVKIEKALADDRLHVSKVS